MNKQEALKEALALIEKNYWKGSIMRLWDDWARQKVETISSGSIGLDIALWGWYAKGRIVEIYWPESSGKTTLTLHAIAEVQKAGWVAAFIDAEHALDPEYAKKIWVNIDALRKITWAISKTNCTVIFINQLRMKIGVMFGSPETTTWGNSLKFYASQRIDIRRKNKIERWTWDNKEVIWNETVVKVIKNKIAPPFREAMVDIMYNEWISRIWEILDFGVDLNIIKKSGAFYSYWDKKLGQWRENVKAFLTENEELANEIEEIIRNSLEK